MTRRIAVLTSGGDSPGMNAAVRAVVRETLARGGEAVGVESGYEGLLDDQFVPMNLGSVGGVLDHGGTFLGTARSERMFTAEGVDLAAKNLRDARVDGLVVIGGEGSFRGAAELIARGARIVGVPATIDNDITGTDTSIGFDTALNTICDAVSKVRDTASSHERTFVIEVMGRHSGMLALHSGLASGADGILVPEKPWRLEDVCATIAQGVARGKRHSIIVVAEGAAHAMGLASDLEKACAHEVKAVVLGHVQRGGAPSAFDRIIASRMGSAAVDELFAGQSSIMVGLHQGAIAKVPLEQTFQRAKTFNPELYDLASVLAR